MTNGVRTHDLGLRRLLPVGAARLLCRTVRAPPADRRGRGSRALDAPALDARTAQRCCHGRSRTLASPSRTALAGAESASPVAVRCRFEMQPIQSCLQALSLSLSLFRRSAWSPSQPHPAPLWPGIGHGSQRGRRREANCFAHASWLTPPAATAATVSNRNSQRRRVIFLGAAAPIPTSVLLPRIEVQNL